MVNSSMHKGNWSPLDLELLLPVLSLFPEKFIQLAAVKRPRAAFTSTIPCGSKPPKSTGRRMRRYPIHLCLTLNPNPKTLNKL